MSTRDEIDEARRQIDEIDDAIADLLARRVRCAITIGRAKKKAGVPVYDPAREAAVLARLEARVKGKIDRAGLKRVFERIMELSRSLEESDDGVDEDEQTEAGARPRKERGR